MEGSFEFAKRTYSWLILDVEVSIRMMESVHIQPHPTCNDTLLFNSSGTNAYKRGGLGWGKTHAALIGAPHVSLGMVPDRLISNLHNLVARIPPACNNC